MLSIEIFLGEFNDNNLLILLNADVAGLNTEPHNFPFDMDCRSPGHWAVLEREAREAVDVLRQPETTW